MKGRKGVSDGYLMLAWWKAGDGKQLISKCGRANNNGRLNSTACTC